MNATHNNKNWLRTEYNSAVLTGQAVSNYHRLIAASKTFPYWEYRTANDNLVREQHQQINGLILPYNDPRWDQIYPPNGWNCRCYIVPRMRTEMVNHDKDGMRALADQYIDSTDFKKAKAQGWGTNRAKDQVVFKANQQYISKQPTKAKAKLDALNHTDFGMPSYPKARQAATDPIPVYEQTREDFLNTLEELIIESVPTKVLRDRMNRPIIIDEESFKVHTSNSVKKREHRIELLDAMKLAIDEPSEVWINGKKLDNMIYLKYFSNGTMVSAIKILNGSLRLTTWFELHPNAVNKYRKGLNIYVKK